VETLLNNWDDFQSLMEGVIPIGDFWVMEKLKGLMDKKALLKQPQKEEVMLAAVTLWRFRSNEVVSRSVDVIAIITTMLKGDKQDRNLLRDLEWIGGFMAAGDL